MTGVMDIRRCGGCGFAKLTPDLAANDMTRRLCTGAPPTAVQVRAPGGRLQIMSTRPIVSVTDDACALYQAKTAFDDMRNSEAVRVAQEAAQSAVPKVITGH